MGTYSIIFVTAYRDIMDIARVRTKKMFIIPTFNWFVSDAGYCWESIRLANGYTARRLVCAQPSSDAGKSDWLDQDLGVASLRSYDPLRDHTGLFRLFAAAKPTELGILVFANRFGPLFSAEVSTIADDLGDSSEQPRDPTDGESLEQWQEAIRAMRVVVALWDAIPASGQGRLPKLPRESPLPTATATEAMALVIEHINQGLSRDATAALVYPYKKRGARLFRSQFQIVPKNLLGALWTQAALAVHEGTEFRTCVKCQEPYALSRFSPKTNTLTETRFCSTRCRVYAYRERVVRARQMHLRGLTNDQIGRELKTDPETVRRWVIRGA
jgi:hypothetical protein